MPPAPMPSDTPGSPLMEKPPAVLLKVRELISQSTSTRGVRRVVPAITMSAVPSFGGGIWGGIVSVAFQLAPVLQLLSLPPPSHVSPARPVEPHNRDAPCATRRWLSR